MHDPKSLQERTTELLEDLDNPEVTNEEYEERRQELEKEWADANNEDS